MRKRRKRKKEEKKKTRILATRASMRKYKETRARCGNKFVLDTGGLSGFLHEVKEKMSTVSYSGTQNASVIITGPFHEQARMFFFTEIFLP
jgi:hypothetical protein